MTDDLVLSDHLVPLSADDAEPGEPVRFSLTGLTKKFKDMPVGTGLLIPAQPNWNDATVSNLRVRIATIAHRCKTSLGDRYTVRTTVRGFEVWRLPVVPYAPGEHRTTNEEQDDGHPQQPDE